MHQSHRSIFASLVHFPTFLLPTYPEKAIFARFSEIGTIT
jgi:hypothetical protein